MHFNFHLSGDESPEQSRRIANAVLALGGLLTQTTGCEFTEEDCPVETPRGHFLDVIRDGHHSRFVGGISDPTAPPLIEDDLPLEPPSPMAEMADALRGKAEAEQFRGALTSDEIRAVDAKGLPWDERIHSSSRAINADGTWRYRKNVPDETKRDVEAELRGLVPAPQLTEADLPPAAPPVPVPPTPPAPPVPTGALQRTYSDVVNLIMARKVQPDTYVAILGMSLPEFAKHVISAPNDATLMFDALDAASRP